MLKYWHRFDENFEPTQPKSQTQASTSNNSNNSQSYKVSASISPQVTTYLAHHNISTFLRALNHMHGSLTQVHPITLFLAL